MTSIANGTPALAVHHAIALDGDKLKPREDQRKGGNGFGINEDGAGYTLTAVDRHGVAYENDHLNRCEVARSLNGDHDDRVTDSGTSVVHVGMAQNTRDEVRIVGDGEIVGALPAEPGMKQQTYVVSTNANGLITKGSGEAILSDEHHMALQCGGGQCGQGAPTCVISTNSNGGDVAPTLTLELARQTGAQQANGGGMSLAAVGIGHDAYNSGRNAKMGMSISSEVEPTMKAKSDGCGAVAIAREGADGE